jgi:DNA (cytosine-5)-methyltransferase 1
VGSTEELPTVISFCSGYGGIERGLELAGFKHRVLAYVEIEAFAVANLVAKMEQGKLAPAPIWTDLKTFPAHIFRGAVDLLVGGYPCQPFSTAGKRKGKEDPRHLWPYIRGHIGVIQPGTCFFENVEGHISLGLATVLSDLEEDGYRATPGLFSAAEVGAPHRRKRVFILGNSKHNGSSAPKITRITQETVGNVKEGQNKTSELEGAGQPRDSEDVADSCGQGLQGSKIIRSNVQDREKPCHEFLGGCDWRGGEFWAVEPDVGRVVDGCPDRVDRIRLLGNGVVPQTAAKAWLTLNEDK